MYDRWSLDVLYTGFDDPKFTEEFNLIDSFIEKYKETANSLGSKDPQATVKECLQLTEEFRETFFRLINFCSLRQNADTNDGEFICVRLV